MRRRRTGSRFALAAALVGLTACGSVDTTPVEVDWPDGTPRFRATLRDGRLHGEYVRFRTDGTRAFEARYVDGALEGQWRSFHPAGGIALEAEMAGGHLDGERRVLSPDGDELEVCGYVGGERHGTRIVHEAGGGRRESTWDEGRPIGVHRNYSSEGNVVEEIHHEDGLAVRQVFFHPNGEPSIEVPMVQGKREGVVQGWYPTGELRKETAWRRGVRHGSHRLLDKSGTVTEKGEHAAGNRVGVWIETLEGAVVHSEYRQGQLHGSWKRVGANGVVLERGEYVANAREGAWVANRSDGSPHTEGPYEGGKRHGTWRTWMRNPNTGQARILEETWVKDTRHGPVTRRTEDGQVVEEGEYQRGKRAGTWRTFHGNGSPSTEGAYAAGKRQGEWRAWRADGSLASEARYEADTLHGPFRRIAPNGTVIEEGAYELGARTGPWTHRSEDGSVDGERSGIYADDERIGPLDG